MEATDPHALTLAMFDYDVPCAFSVIEGEGCDDRAQWLISIKHLTETDCDTGPPMPFCDRHKAMIVTSMTGFFAQYLGTANEPCAGCGVPVTIDKVEPIKP